MKINLIYFGIGILFIFVFLSLICANNNLIQIYPENGSAITERQPTFKWSGKADKIIIDDNDEFVSPVIGDVTGNSYLVKNKLNFTTYYWRLSGNKNSSVWQFEIQSLVALSLKNQSDLYNVTNIGNTNLDVEIHEKNRSFWKITGKVVIEQDKTKQIDVKNSTLFVAKQR